MRTNRVTTLPFVFAFMAGLLAMPALNIYAINARNHGTEQTEPWRSTLSLPAIQQLVAIGTRVREWFAELTHVPLLTSEVGAVGNIKQLIQNEADIKAAMRALKQEGRKLDGGARLTQVLSELTALEQRDDDNAAALVIARRLQEDERAEGARIVAPGGVVLAMPAKGRRFAQMFPRVALDMGGFASADEFLATLDGGLVDPRLMFDHAPQGLHATATGAIPSDGGFSVPSQIFAEWLDRSLEDEVVRPRADVRPMFTQDASAPAWDDNDHTSTLYGGFSGEWLAEDGTMTAQTPRMRMVALKARKLGLLSSASNELVADGIDYDQQLGVAITKALGWFLDCAFLGGTGANQPLGVRTSGAAITVTKETGQAAATIVYANLVKMFARLHPGSFKTAVWVINSTAIPYLLQLSIPVGTAGSHVPVMTESGGQFRILTLPVVFTEKVPSVGTVGDVGLIDFSQYVVGMRANFQLAKSAHAGFSQDKTFYRGIIRVDGQPKLSSAITPKNGLSVGPFVFLETRS